MVMGPALTCRWGHEEPNKNLKNMCVPVKMLWTNWTKPSCSRIQWSNVWLIGSTCAVKGVSRTSRSAGDMWIIIRSIAPPTAQEHGETHASLSWNYHKWGRKRQFQTPQMETWFLWWSGIAHLPIDLCSYYFLLVNQKSYHDFNMIKPL